MKAYNGIICLILLVVIPNCADYSTMFQGKNDEMPAHQSDKVKHHDKGLAITINNKTENHIINNEKDSTMEDTALHNKKMITMNSGLRYEVITDSPDGRQAQKGNFVEVHYTGWLNDGRDNPGKEFDSSVKRNETFEFPLGVGHVIKGWDEGVACMKVGQKIRLYIPAVLGYGTRGAGAVIPPNSDLIFDVELIAIS